MTGCKVTVPEENFLGNGTLLRVDNTRPCCHHRMAYRGPCNHLDGSLGSWQVVTKLVTKVVTKVRQVPGGHHCLASACLTTSGRPTPLQPCLCPSHPLLLSNFLAHQNHNGKKVSLNTSRFFAERESQISQGIMRKEGWLVPMAVQGVVLSSQSPSSNCRRSSWNAGDRRSLATQGPARLAAAG